MKQLCENTNSLMVIQPGRIEVFLSFSLVYILLVDSVTISNSQIEWRQSRLSLARGPVSPGAEEINTGIFK